MKKAPNTLQASGALGEQLSFIDPAPFCPAFPTRGTLPDALLSRLLSGERMTQPEWLGISGSWRLAASAGELGDLGWPVESLLVPAPSMTNPNRKIARYGLSHEAVAAGLALVRKGQS